MSANPAPAPTLQTPAANATNVDPDGWFGWRWVDDLMANGSFESGLTPGWYTGGQYPSVWKVYTSTTNAWGMGYRFVSTDFTLIPAPAYGQIIQDIYVPADATSATLSW